VTGVAEYQLTHIGSFIREVFNDLAVVFEKMIDKELGEFF